MRPRLTYANVISTVCLFLLLAGGTALATHPGGQNTISTADIQNGQVKTDDLGNGEVKVADVGQGAVATDELANGQVKAADIGTGEVRSANVANDNLTGADIATNSLKGADIDENSLDIGDTARAYAYVTPSGCPSTPGACTTQESKGISSVTRLAAGFYCVTAPGISQAGTPAAVTVDYRQTESPEGNAAAMTDEAGCGANGFVVATERQQNIIVLDGSGNPTTAVGPAIDANDVAFTIVIP